MVTEMEFIEPLEHYLDSFISILKLLLETIATICVLAGLIRTFREAVSRSPYLIPLA